MGSHPKSELGKGMPLTGNDFKKEKERTESSPTDRHRQKVCVVNRGITGTERKLYSHWISRAYPLKESGVYLREKA